MLCAAPTVDASRTLYAPDVTNSQIYVLPLGTNGGTLGGSSLPIGSSPAATVVSPDGTHLYEATSGTTPISVFDVDGANGSLTPRTAITAPVPAALAITPSGSMLLAASRSGSVSSYALDAQGVPSALLGSSATLAGVAASGISVSPDGGRVYVTYEEANGAGHIADFALGAGGALQPLHDAATGASPRGITLASNGARVYVANAGSSSISGYAVGADGNFTLLPNSPYLTGAGPNSIAATPDGMRLLVADATAGSVDAFTVGATGALTPVGTNTTVAGASTVAIAPDGAHAFIGGTATIRAFNLASDAVLTANGSAIVTSGQHAAFVVSPDQPPVARFGASPAPAASDSTFDAGSSTDPDGTVAQWAWSFGDGQTGSGAVVKHTYAQPGTYTVRLTVTDNEGCSTALRFTGQTVACTGSINASQSQVITVPPAVIPPPVDQSCAHDGNDGFCGLPDQKAPMVTIVGLSDGASITTLDAPDVLAGAITPDPSGISNVKLRFTKAAGMVLKRKTFYKRVCRKARDTNRRSCHRRRVIKKTNTKIPVCMTVSGTKNYLVKYVCSRVPWVTMQPAETFRYALPVALGVGSYTLDAIATDGAGNTDVLQDGRNHIAFKIIRTPPNQGSSGTAVDTTGPTTATPSTPINDTGSPFSRR